MQVAELINAIMLAEHPHFRNVVRDALPFVAIKLADLQGDHTLQHIEAFLEQARLVRTARANVPQPDIPLQSPA